MKNHVEWAFTIGVDKANPNGDPDNANMPRTLSNGKGYISDCCIKHKIRNRMNDILGDGNVLIHPQTISKGVTCSTDIIISELTNAGLLDSPKANIDFERNREFILDKYVDVRLFGHLLTTIKSAKTRQLFKRGVTGSFSIGQTESIEPINITSTAITKCIDEAKGEKHDTMGEKYFVERGVYSTFATLNGNMFTKNRSPETDIDLVQESILTMFENDASAARPAGSMGVIECIRFDKDIESDSYGSSFDVKRLLTKAITPFGSYDHDIVMKIANDTGRTVTWLKTVM